MKILMLHNAYKIRGGEDISTKNEFEMLKEAGHDVELVIFDNSDINGFFKTIKTAAQSIWNHKIYKWIRKEIRDKKYDIVHIQNNFPLISPSVYLACNKENVPVIQSIRNYRLICPSANLYRNGSLCTDCVNKKIKYPAIIHKCYKDSYLASAAVSLTFSIHAILGTWNKQVTKFITVSSFVKDKLVIGGVDSSKIVVKPNFLSPINSDFRIKVLERKYILYVGRISNDKGIGFLDRFLEKYDLGVDILAIGEGEHSSYSNRINFLGKKSLVEIYSYMQQAECVLIPGEWPEPFGRVAVEAMANSTPIIASRTGGLTELVFDGINGFTFDSGNMEQLHSLIIKILAEGELSEGLGLNGLNIFNDKYGSQKNYQVLMNTYLEAIEDLKNAKM
jgi:glycosyltransferase involved in cell wall biosynthesis